MIISLIAALDERGCIGAEGKLPWRLSSDLKRFKKITMDHHLVMGRKTFESIGRPLPGRNMIVLSRNMDYYQEDVAIVHSIKDAFHLAKEREESELFVIGGGEVFAQVMNVADRFYLTRVHARVECDTYFPEFDLDDWEILDCQEIQAGKEDEHPSTFTLLSRLHHPEEPESRDETANYRIFP